MTQSYRPTILISLAALCPRDTDGDGNCGQHLCPWCGTAPEVDAARFRFVRALIKAAAEDIWGNTRIVEHARSVMDARWPGDGEALMALLGLHWGWDPVEGADDPNYWEGPREFLDEYLHLIRGATHGELIDQLRQLARSLDPEYDEHYPGGRANQMTTKMARSGADG